MAKQTSRKRPDYIVVEGVILSAGIDPQALRDTLKFEPRKGDIVLATYPKCGTNWAQQITLLLRNNGVSKGNIDEFMDDCPVLEIEGVDNVQRKPSPRFYRSHLPFPLIPYSTDAKYIWVVRNPKDCLVSCYHQTASAIFDYVDGDFDDFFEIFMKGENDYGDYFDHVLSWYEHRNDSNVLSLYYEDMKKDVRAAIQKIATFLGTEYQEFIKNPRNFDQIVHYSSFEHMKIFLDETQTVTSPDIDIDSLPITPSLKHFYKYVRSKNVSHEPVVALVRKGIVGGWRNIFSAEQNRRINEKIEERLQGTEMLEFWKRNDCL